MAQCLLWKRWLRTTNVGRRKTKNYSNSVNGRRMPTHIAISHLSDNLSDDPHFFYMVLDLKSIFKCFTYSKGIQSSNVWSRPLPRREDKGHCARASVKDEWPFFSQKINVFVLFLSFSIIAFDARHLFLICDMVDWTRVRFVSYFSLLIPFAWSIHEMIINLLQQNW